MQKSLSVIISNMLSFFPAPIRAFGRKLGVNVFFNPFLQKIDGELLYQKTRVNDFQNNKNKYLQKWKNVYSLNEIIKLTKISNNSKVLDIGCGIASVLHFLPGKRYGLDPLANEYKKIYTYPKQIRVNKGIGESLQFNDHFFNIVFCTNALDHTDNPKQVIKEIYRVLKQNGFFVCIVDIFTKRIRRDKTHTFCFTNKDVKLLIKDKFKIKFEKKVTSGFASESSNSLVFIARKI